MKTPTLKNCPFCGSSNVEVSHWQVFGHLEYAVACMEPDCGACGPCDLGKSGAIAKWNMTDGEPALPDIASKEKE